MRQSRHQFGSDKDVFGPRFVKNITTTFQHLFKCSEEDRVSSLCKYFKMLYIFSLYIFSHLYFTYFFVQPKIIRVLNLWQKNNVFPIDVIQPLLDMGHPNTSNECK